MQVYGRLRNYYKGSLSEARLEHVDIDITVEFMNNFLWNITKAWKKGDLHQRKVLTGSIFPKNVVYEYPGFRTEELGTAFKYLRHEQTTPQTLGVT